MAARAWKKANPEKVREQTITRRARISGADGRLPRGTISSLLLKQRAKCACCKSSIKTGYHVDHIMPLARGGKHEASNLQLLCPPCNMSKNAKHPIDFMQQRGFLL